ncbi:MAG: Zn-dependent hydrolase [Cyanobacteria bacterium 13_1_40CM_2_61_4]|nr:MAG: Zn-dependent hydrolase [Cyanobacteria bacterium 13_1_40CM_2_61_4]
MFEYQGLKISWLGHDSFRIRNGKTVIIDPFKIRPIPEKADILLITHEHYDHLSIDDIKKVVNENTTIVTIPAVKKELFSLKVKEVKAVKPGDRLKLGDVSIEVVPAYNLNKFREPGKVFHPKEDGKVGYIVGINGVRVYHAGDTDAIPEMKGLKPDVALLPVSGTYVMTADEAAQAAKVVEPKVAIPMHYGVIVGTEQDAQKFKQLATVEVQILKPE